MGVNPNTMTFKKVFSNEYMMSHFKQPVYQVLAETSLVAGLTKGQIVARSYASDVVANDMGGDGSYEPQAIVDTEETLTVNKEKEASIYVKKLDELQAHLPVKQKYARKLVSALINQIDGDVLLAAYQGATSNLSDGDIGGTSGNGINTTSTNVGTVFTLAMQTLMKQNVVYNANARFAGISAEVPEGMPIAIIPAEVLTQVQLYLGGKDTVLGDKVATNGYRGYFMGFEMFMSNALPWTATLGIATQPTDGDTVTINGVTFTFKTTLGSTAGNVLIGASADTAATNLAALVNAPTTTTAQGVALSTANANKMKNIVATANNSVDTVTFVSAGWGVVVVSETLTAAADIWTSGLQIVHGIFGLSKSVSLVVQKDPSLEENFVSRKVGRDYIAWSAYGIKVFADQAPQLVDVKFLSSAYTASSSTVR